MKYEVKNDGVDHINIYSKGQTELGRLLSNFAHTPFFIPGSGVFASVEAYWYWLLLVQLRKYDKLVDMIKLRELHGFAAKKFGRELLGTIDENSQPYDAAFRIHILKAFYAKVDAHRNIRELLKASTLPFAHYYVFNGVVKPVERHQWQLTYWEQIRRELRDGFIWPEKTFDDSNDKSEQSSCHT